MIGICHSGGLRLHEVLGPMELFGQLFYRNVLYPGVIPQITLVMGTVAGGQAYSPGLTDFIIMTKQSNIFIAGPAFVKTIIKALKILGVREKRGRGKSMEISHCKEGRRRWISASQTN